MNKKEVKNYMNMFMVYILYSILMAIDNIEDEKFNNMLVGEVFEKFIDILNMFVKFFNTKSSDYKEEFIRSLINILGGTNNEKKH